MDNELNNLHKLVQDAKRELGNLKSDEEILPKIYKNNNLIASFKIKNKVDIKINA